MLFSSQQFNGIFTLVSVSRVIFAVIWAHINRTYGLAAIGQLSIDQSGWEDEKRKKEKKRWSNYTDSRPHAFISIKFVRSAFNQRSSFSTKLILYVVVSKKRVRLDFELLPFIRTGRTIRSFVHRVLIVTLREIFVTISSKSRLVSKIKQPPSGGLGIGDDISLLWILHTEKSLLFLEDRATTSPFPLPPLEDKLTNFSPRISRRISIRVSYDFHPREEWRIISIVSSLSLAFLFADTRNRGSKLPRITLLPPSTS